MVGSTWAAKDVFVGSMSLIWGLAGTKRPVHGRRTRYGVLDKKSNNDLGITNLTLIHRPTSMLVDHLTRQILFSSQSVITSFYTTSLTVFQHDMFLFCDLLETIILERVVHVCMEVAVLATHQTRVILACFRCYSQSTYRTPCVDFQAICNNIRHQSKL